MARTATCAAPRLTRAEARMIAEEVVRLLKADASLPPSEDYIGVKEAAAFLGCSVSYIYHNIDRLPYTCLGGGRKKMFLKSKLAQYAASR